MSGWRHLGGIILLVGSSLGMAACHKDSGGDLVGLADGKIVPPGATLTSDYFRKGAGLFVTPVEERSYRSSLGIAAIDEFYAVELGKRGWAVRGGRVSGSETILTWDRDGFSITVAQPESFDAEPDQFSVSVRRGE